MPPPAVVPPVLVGLAVVSEHLAVLVALPVSFYLHDGRLRRHAKRCRSKRICFLCIFILIWIFISSEP